jgi:hypothetical protein
MKNRRLWATSATALLLLVGCGQTAPELSASNKNISDASAITGDTVSIDEESYQLFIKRYVYFLRSQKQLNKRSVAAGFFILLEIQNEILKRESEKRLYRTKNIKILKYRDEIVELYQRGSGVVKISNIIKQNHNCSISKSSIQRFIQANNIKREV